jgi:hypothetical protein
MARYLNTTRGTTLDRGDGRFSAFGDEIEVDELNDTMRDHLESGRIVELAEPATGPAARSRMRVSDSIEEDTP